MRMFLRPRWLVVHAVALAIAVVLINLGFWQLRRLDERRAENRQITQNLGLPVQPLDRTLAESGNDPQGLAYRRVSVTGRYRPADEVLLTPRSNGKTAGHHVLTPLVDAGGQGVLVDRGWVPFADDEPPIAEAAPPADEVEVTGIIVPTTTAARFGSSTSASELTYLSAPDVDRIQPHVDVTLYPFSILLQQQDPAPGRLPVPGEPPEVTEGSHQSYAWQWFSFAAILLVGYPLLLRRSLQSRTRTPSRPTASGGT